MLGTTDTHVMRQRAVLKQQPLKQVCTHFGVTHSSESPYTAPCSLHMDDGAMVHRSLPQKLVLKVNSRPSDSHFTIWLWWSNQELSGASAINTENSCLMRSPHGQGETNKFSRTWSGFRLPPLTHTRQTTVPLTHARFLALAVGSTQRAP